MTLPEGVERKQAKGHVYYYWTPHRMTTRQGQRVRLPNAEADAVGFWREIDRLRRVSEETHYDGSVGHLIARYRASEEFQRLAASARASYEVSLDRFEKSEAWASAGAGWV